MTFVNARLTVETAFLSAADAYWLAEVIYIQLKHALIYLRGSESTTYALNNVIKVHEVRSRLTPKRKRLLSLAGVHTVTMRKFDMGSHRPSFANTWRVRYFNDE